MKQRLAQQLKQCGLAHHSVTMGQVGSGSAGRRAVVRSGDWVVTREATTAESNVMAVFVSNYAGLVRLAMLLSRDAAEAEDVAQDAFLKVYPRSARIGDSDAVLAYLRRTVVNLCHSRGRRAAVAARLGLSRASSADALPDHANAVWQRIVIAQALARLPARQREAVVLRFYLDYTDTNIAEAMGIAPGAARAHLSRAQAALTALLKGERA